MSSNIFIARTDNDQQDEIKRQQYEDLRDNPSDSVIKSKIYNLSVKDISENLSQTFIDMINEFSLYRNDDNKKWNDYIRIITNEDRLIYVGIIFVIISLIVFFIDVSR